jgi:DedD protein
MNEILKQRLVGALILIALGVVFWPIIFVEPAVQPLGEAAQVPVRPTIDTTPIDPPGREGVRSSPALQADEEPPPPVEATAASEAALLIETKPAVIENPLERASVPQKPSPGGKPAPPAAKKQPATRTQAPVKPAIDADGVPIGWILQVASVSSPTKAEELRSGLVDMGYKAYIKKIKRENGVLLRVYVGPKFERARLEAIQPRVDAQFKVKSMVRRYIP